MNVEVLAVGTELLLGQIVNSNAAEIGERLAAAGIGHFRQTVVGDNRSRLTEAIREAVRRADALVITGGIGPTQDDLTREALAEAAGVEMNFSEDYAEQLRQRWEQRGRRMPDTNLRQAEYPAGAHMIPNAKGTAPGLRMLVDECWVFAVPGVPQEMLPMVEQVVIPFLQQQDGGEGGVLVSRLLRTWGESESRIAELLDDVFTDSENPTLAFLASGGEIKLRLTARAADRDGALASIEPVERELRDRLGPLVFAADDETIASLVLDLCRRKEWTIGTAESATGGLVAAELTAIPGASDVFRGGVVAYHPAIKRALLDVPSEAMAGGVVSEEVAIAMAKGAIAALEVDVAVSVTGSAGPSDLGGREVGTMVVGVATADRARARTLRLPGDRERVRTFTTTAALHLVRLAITGEWW